MICKKCGREVSMVSSTERSFFDSLRVAECRDYIRCGCGVMYSKPYFVRVRRPEDGGEDRTFYAPLNAAVDRLKELRDGCSSRHPTKAIMSETTAITAFLDHVYPEAVVDIIWRKGVICLDLDEFGFEFKFAEELK